MKIKSTIKTVATLAVAALTIGLIAPGAYAAAPDTQYLVYDSYPGDSSDPAIQHINVDVDANSTIYTYISSVHTLSTDASGVETISNCAGNLTLTGFYSERFTITSFSGSTSIEASPGMYDGEAPGSYDYTLTCNDPSITTNNTVSFTVNLINDTYGVTPPTVPEGVYFVSGDHQFNGDDVTNQQITTTVDVNAPDSPVQLGAVQVDTVDAAGNEVYSVCSAVTVTGLHSELITQELIPGTVTLLNIDPTVYAADAPGSYNYTVTCNDAGMTVNTISLTVNLVNDTYGAPATDPQYLVFNTYPGDGSVMTNQSSPSFSVNVDNNTSDFNLEFKKLIASSPDYTYESCTTVGLTGTGAEFIIPTDNISYNSLALSSVADFSNTAPGSYNIAITCNDANMTNNSLTFSLDVVNSSYVAPTGPVAPIETTASFVTESAASTYSITGNDVTVEYYVTVETVSDAGPDSSLYVFPKAYNSPNLSSIDGDFTSTVTSTDNLFTNPTTEVVGGIRYFTSNLSLSVTFVDAAPLFTNPSVSGTAVTAVLGTVTDSMFVLDSITNEFISLTTKDGFVISTFTAGDPIVTPPPVVIPPTVPDVNFQACLNDALGRGASDPIDESVLLGATFDVLDCSNSDITSIEGIQFLSGKLYVVDFSGNNISDISPLSDFQLLGNWSGSYNNNGLGGILLLNSNPLGSLSSVNLDSVLTLDLTDTNVSTLPSLSSVIDLRLLGTNITDVSGINGGVGSLVLPDLFTNYESLNTVLNPLNLNPIYGEGLRNLTVGNVNATSALTLPTQITLLAIRSYDADSTSYLSGLSENLNYLDVTLAPGIPEITDIYLLSDLGISSIYPTEAYGIFWGEFNVTSEYNQDTQVLTIKAPFVQYTEDVNFTDYWLRGLIIPDGSSQLFENKVYDTISYDFTNNQYVLTGVPIDAIILTDEAGNVVNSNSTGVTDTNTAYSGGGVTYSLSLTLNLAPGVTPYLGTEYRWNSEITIVSDTPVVDEPVVDEPVVDEPVVIKIGGADVLPGIMLNITLALSLLIGMVTLTAYVYKSKSEGELN